MLMAMASVAASALAPSARAQQPAAPPIPARPSVPAADNEVSEVVVSAAAVPYQVQPGAVIGDIQPEIQLSPADIQSYGVSTVSDLLNELGPQTGSGQGRGGESPVVLLNGKRISGFNEVRDIPTEAILRVDILPEEVALKYGFTADQKVVNFVLRPRFSSVTGEVNGGGPTAGGQINGSAEAIRFGVQDDNRINIDLKVSGNSDLTYASRGLNGGSTGAAYALQGNIAAAVGRGPIDPALSALAGRALTLAGVPAAAAGRAPTLADFASGTINTDNLGRDRDLASANQNLSANMVVARALGGGYAATFNASFNTGASQSMQGLPSLTLTVPAGSPYSPFASDVRLYRYVDALGLLNQDTSNWSGHLAGTLNKQDGAWRFNVTASYDHSDTLIETGSGVDPAPLQALLSARAASFNPYAPITASMLSRLPNSEARSLSDGGNLQAVAFGPLLKVPAGQLTTSLRAGDSQSDLTASSFRQGVLQAVELGRNELSAQANFDLPLTSRRNNVLPQMGELSINTNMIVDRLSDFGTIRSLGYGVNWQPIPQVRLIVSHTRDEAAPSVSQLGSPTVLTPGVRLYDFATGLTADVTTISGPNPGLAGDTRNVFKAGLTLKPWSDRQFTVTANYIDQRTDRPIGAFPAATAAIEAAFPDRFIRDAAGDLTEVDQRPTNFAWTRRQNIRWGLNYSRPVGQAPQRPAGAPAQGQGGGGQGQGGGQGRGGFRGGGPGGFGGGPGGGGQGQGRFEISAYHTVYFVDQTLLRPGVPLLDFLNGAPAGRNGAQPVHSVEGQLGYTQGGLGARINANWVEGATVQGAGLSPSGLLSFSDLTAVHLRLFANFAQIQGVARNHPWLSGARLTIGLYNVFDQHLKVKDATGATPLGYQAPFLDATGRTFSVTFRKLMF